MIKVSNRFDFAVKVVTVQEGEENHSSEFIQGTIIESLGYDVDELIEEESIMIFGSKEPFESMMSREKMRSLFEVIRMIDYDKVEFHYVEISEGRNYLSRGVIEYEKERECLMNRYIGWSPIEFNTMLKDKFGIEYVDTDYNPGDDWDRSEYETFWHFIDFAYPLEGPLMELFNTPLNDIPAPTKDSRINKTLSIN